MTHEDARLKQLKRWIFDCGFNADSLQPASADASFRRYFRLADGDSSWIVMDSPPEHNDNQPFLAISRRLENAGINAPVVERHDLQAGFILLGDLGSRHYLDVLDQSNAAALYADAIRTIVDMQSRVDTDGLALYDEQALRAEMQLFPEWFVGTYKGLSLNRRQQDCLEATFALCVSSALEQPAAFVHRDYHSRNLMYLEQRNPGVLDFQDAVRGPLTYDIVSLLKDCYISWPEEFVYSLLEDFRRQLVREQGIAADRQTFERWFDLMGLQRHLKVLGIFCRLNFRDGKPAYMNDLPLVFRYVERVCRKYPALAEFHQLLDEIGANEGLS
ncbi:MAG: phosphotransferase [Gammaproteobacteria bacterium]|nr:phosphotransferase [Gammaproteobacteria bacterium]